MVATWNIANIFWPAQSTQASGNSVDMSISNTALPEQAQPGQDVTFFYYYQNETLTFNNQTPSIINITADIPAWLEFVSSVPTPSSVTPSSLAWNNVDLTDGAYGFVIVQMRVSNTPPNTITHTAYLQMPNDTDPIPTNNEQSATISIPAWSTPIDPGSLVDLSIQKTGPLVANIWQTIGYTIEYANVWLTTATNILIVDVIPSGTQFIPNGIIAITADPQPTIVTGAFGEIFIRNIPSLSPGQSGVITMSGVVSPWLPQWFGLFNLAQISSTVSADSNSQNNFAFATTVVETQWADLSITKTASQSNVSVWQTFTYNITARNNWSNIATGIIVTDTLPAWLSIVSAPWATVMSNTYTRSISSLQPNNEVLFTISVQANQAGTITNAAQISASTFDPILANNTSSFPVTITQWGTNNTGTNNTGTNTNNTW
jgi:uncharacterized repeat protein (TIGR01451 family)